METKYKRHKRLKNLIGYSKQSSPAVAEDQRQHFIVSITTNITWSGY